jgi:hypothetical protein
MSHNDDPMKCRQIINNEQCGMQNWLRSIPSCSRETKTTTTTTTGGYTKHLFCPSHRAGINVCPVCTDIADTNNIYALFDADNTSTPKSGGVEMPTDVLDVCALAISAIHIPGDNGAFARQKMHILYSTDIPEYENVPQTPVELPRNKFAALEYAAELLRRENEQRGNPRQYELLYAGIQEILKAYVAHKYNRMYSPVYNAGRN